MNLQQLSRLRAMVEYLTNGRMHENPWGLNRDDLNAINAAICGMPNPRLIQAIEAVLMFHSGEPWDSAKSCQWSYLTQNRDATTKGLCDFLRETLGTQDR